MIAKLPLVPFVIINLTAGLCMKVRFKSNVTKGFSLLAASRLSRGSRKTNGNRVGYFQQQSETFLNKSFNLILFLSILLDSNLSNLLTTLAFSSSAAANSLIIKSSGLFEKRCE